MAIEATEVEELNFPESWKGKNRDVRTQCLSIGGKQK